MLCLPIQGSNEILCSYSPNLLQIKAGSYILLKDTNTLYQILKSEEKAYTYACRCKNNILTLNEETNSLWKNEMIGVVYPIFEIACVLIKDKGTKFKNKMQATILGDSMIEAPLFEITSVDGLGADSRIKH